MERYGWIWDRSKGEGDERRSAANPGSDKPTIASYWDKLSPVAAIEIP